MRSAALLAVLAAVGLVGCGSSSSSSPTTSAVSTELSYFPTYAPLVATIATSPNAGSVQQLQGALGRIPSASFGIAALEAELSKVGLSYQNDVHPLFGNPIALGLATGSAVSANQFLAVWVTKDSSALQRVVSKAFGGSSTSTHDGATLYSAGALGVGFTLAIDGATLVAGSNASVTAALDRHAQGGGFTSAEFQSDTAGLPQHTLVEAVGSLTSVLAQSSAAHTIPWVGAIRSYGAAVTASSSGINLQFHLATDGAPLSGSQLPVAPGTTPPSLTGSMPIEVAVHDPAQTVAFLEQALPKKFASLTPRKRSEIAGLSALFSGDLILGTDTHGTLVRATVSDPAKAAGLLAHAGDLKPAGGGFYSRGSRLFAIIGDQYVVGTRASRAQMSSFAAAPVTPASFAHGGVAFQIRLQDLLALTLKHAPPQILQTVLSQLGNITGWAASSPGSLTGSATLAIK